VKPIDLSKLRTYKASERMSKVTYSVDCKKLKKGMMVDQFLASLPHSPKINELKRLALDIIHSRREGKPVIVMMGGHVVKTGCRGILLDLAANKFITHFASNGSFAIHDTELALYGCTSEDVDQQINDGSFGMASDTAEFINGAALYGYGNGLGFGAALGDLLQHHAYSETIDGYGINYSFAGRCYDMEVPYTIHVAIGTDIVHQHPSADGAAIGASSLTDFRILANSVSQLIDGGVVLNIGSSVIMPEVFIKALSVARNLNRNVSGFTTANFDMLQHYRPMVNVVKRPTAINGGHGYHFTGYHEIMLPLLATLIYELGD
jgi:hypothetical protein